jgi:hypothetical protein
METVARLRRFEEAHEAFEVHQCEANQIPRPARTWGGRPARSGRRIHATLLRARGAVQAQMLGMHAVGSAALLTRDVGVDRHVGPGPLRSPEIDICEKHDRGLEVARSPGGEHVRLGEADLGRGPASPQQVVAQLRE